MRDLLAAIAARFQSSNRQQKLIFLLGAILLVFVARFGVSWVIDYREGLNADIRLAAQRLTSANQLIETAPQTERQLQRLRKRYQAIVSKLVPGDTPTLAAAELQDLVSSLAAKNNVRVQTTQVLQDEAVGSFRQVSLRVTASGTTRQLAGMLSMLEFGDLRIRIPYFELNRRGGSSRRRRKNKVPRSASVTFQVTGIIAGSAAPPKGIDIPQSRIATGEGGSRAQVPAKPPESKVQSVKIADGAATVESGKSSGARSGKRIRSDSAVAPSGAWMRNEKGRAPRGSGLSSRADSQGGSEKVGSSLAGGVVEAGASPKAGARGGAAASGDGLRVSAQ